VYTAVLIVGALLICSRVNLIQISVAVQVMNALLLPLGLGFLYLLARRLPEPHRLQGGYSALVASVILITAGLGVYAAILGVWTS
jgi:Mn2+/Fe2+ NRAMP family transporter